MSTTITIPEASPRPSPREAMKDAITAIRENADLIDRLVRVVGEDNPACVDFTEDAAPETQAIRDALMALNDIRLDLGTYPLTPWQTHRINTHNPPQTLPSQEIS